MTIALLFSLCGISFISATLLPAQSELALAALLLSGELPTWLLITVAWIGNTGGSCLNWLLGRIAQAASTRRWFPVSEKNRMRAEKWYLRHGRWCLLLSWAPIIGDPITLAAGILGERFLPFLLLVSMSKLARYITIAVIVKG